MLPPMRRNACRRFTRRTRTLTPRCRVTAQARWRGAKPRTSLSARSTTPQHRERLCRSGRRLTSSRPSQGRRRPPPSSCSRPAALAVGPLTGPQGPAATGPTWRSSTRTAPSPWATSLGTARPAALACLSWALVHSSAATTASWKASGTSSCWTGRHRSSISSTPRRLTTERRGHSPRMRCPSDPRGLPCPCPRAPLVCGASRRRRRRRLLPLAEALLVGPCSSWSPGCGPSASDD
mmetsp:Transcript_64657/g.185940  ORF Transcript_64657/g.185940 Transcript_64657/m.185940 type:complete len:236 (+) Transcript_64657:885-1592(+)